MRGFRKCRYMGFRGVFRDRFRPKPQTLSQSTETGWIHLHILFFFRQLRNGERQIASIAGSKISYSILMRQELLKGFNARYSSSKFCIQMDISKAFNSVNLEFVIFMLKTMSVKESFISWVHICISSSSFATLVNGQSSDTFGSSRGLKQGDPL